MKENHKLALYVAYYLARFDELAYGKLELGTQKTTHESIGRNLGVNPHTLKNMRDEFDPQFGNRAGWHQRTMSPSRVQVMNALGGLDENQVFDVVKAILNNSIDTSEKAQLVNVITDQERNSADSSFISRGSTGRQAEDFFISHFAANRKPHDGLLKDTRNDGCGYDFEIVTGGKCFFIEVKGLSEEKGGILFTDKEWHTAARYGDDYFLVIVNNIERDPDVSIIRNPYATLRPRREIFTAVQVQWTFLFSGL